MDTKNFVTYEQALQLKELGFNLRCYYHYDTTAFKPEYICPNFTANDGEGDWWIYADNCNLYDDMNSHQYCSAPILSQVQDWLRITHNIFLTVDLYFLNHSSGNHEYSYIIVDMREEGKAHRKEATYNKKIWFKTPEEALSAGIDECLKMLTEN